MLIIRRFSSSTVSKQQIFLNRILNDLQLKVYASWMYRNECVVKIVDEQYDAAVFMKIWKFLVGE